MNVSKRRVRAIFRKELREYRHNGSIVSTMAVIPLIFVIPPMIQIFALPASAASALQHEDPLLYVLGIPAIVPALVAAYAVVGERQQGTLEPVLTTSIRREEFLPRKSRVGLALLVLAGVEPFAQSAVASALLRGPEILAQLVFTPLLAGWSIWVGMAISARSSDIRVAQQLGMLASLPSVAVTSLLAYN